MNTAIPVTVDNFTRMRGLVGISILALSSVAISAPTLVGTPTNASGIDGIVVDGVKYDVTFSTSSFDSTFTDRALLASRVLAGGLNALKVKGLSFGGASGFDCTAAENAVPFCAIYTGASQQWGAAVRRAYPWTGEVKIGNSLGCAQNTDFGGPTCIEAAHWNKVASSAPEPATLALFGLGLFGLGLSRRRFAR